jgi:hypothetical protein
MSWYQRQMACGIQKLRNIYWRMLPKSDIIQVLYDLKEVCKCYREK